jgi:hypothetical protein
MELQLHMLLIPALDMGAQLHALATLTLGKSPWYPLGKTVDETLPKWSYVYKIDICIIMRDNFLLYVLLSLLVLKMFLMVTFICIHLLLLEGLQV